MTDTARLPARMQAALKTSDGGRSLLDALYALEAEDADLGWVSLWKVAEREDRDAARTLAFALARHGASRSTTEAVGLWFLRVWAKDDLSTIVNVLTSLEKELEKIHGLPRSWCRSVAKFVYRCLDHSEVIVRHSVLDLLETAVEEGRVAEFVKKGEVSELTLRLRTALDATAEPDELTTLQQVCVGLAREAANETLPVSSPALEKLAADIETVARRLAHHEVDLDGLTDAVRAAQRDEARDLAATASQPLDVAVLAASAVLSDRYQRQLRRIENAGQQTDCIADAVAGVLQNLPQASGGAIVIYGDPQSGKTEMMICLTAKLLDEGHKVVIHLMNDSVDLLAQSLDRFRLSGLAPAPRNSSDLAESPPVAGHDLVLFCKKNPKDLRKLIDALAQAGVGPVIVVDDEADYATPNARINQNETTKINELVGELLGADGKYIGVTATPARLNLNNTFNNRTETWVQFRPHRAYTGQSVFFPPVTERPRFRLKFLDGPGTEDDARRALARFLVTVAHLNTRAIARREVEQNYTFLVHTSGKTTAHAADRQTIEQAMKVLKDASGPSFAEFVTALHEEARVLYPQDDATLLAKYVIENASRSTFVVLNSKRGRNAAGDNPAEPTCPFTVIIGGNIVSRGVTFKNLLAMFFTRDVKSKLQQDTYIQRARMFGARGAYLPHFELTIPRALYQDWHRCFVFHRLALAAIKNNNVSPVWLGDKRISVVSPASINRATVDLDKGEMSFTIFDSPPERIAELDRLVAGAPRSVSTLRTIAAIVGRDAMPEFLIEYLEESLGQQPGTLAIHRSRSVANYKSSANLDTIERKKGFIGNPQLEQSRFPGAVHHIMIIHNGRGQARVFYKNLGGVEFVQSAA